LILWLAGIPGWEEDVDFAGMTRGEAGALTGMTRRVAGALTGMTRGVAGALTGMTVAWGGGGFGWGMGTARRVMAADGANGDSVVVAMKVVGGGPAPAMTKIRPPRREFARHD
jgi:hypothetical protein